MPIIGVYDWSMVSTPDSLAERNLYNDLVPNDPAARGYSRGAPSWVGGTYTYTGGAPVRIRVLDDDGIFEDNLTETGRAAVLAEDVTLNGKTYPAGSVVENEFSLVDATGTEAWVVRIGGENVGCRPRSRTTRCPPGRLSCR